MKFLTNIFGRRKEEPDKALQFIQEKFVSFLDLLESNNRVLLTMSDMVEKSHGRHPFDIDYVRSSMKEIDRGARTIIREMVALGGERYRGLQERYDTIHDEIESFMEGGFPVIEDDLVIPMEQLSLDRKFSVGSKNARLGELRSVLGLPVPEGFAISAWAYKRFMDANDFQARISRWVSSVNIKRDEDLRRVSGEIRRMVKSGEVPRDLVEAIHDGYARVRQRFPSGRFALRSSAIGEDTHLSFAGQYATYLNVNEESIIDRYRGVLASKFRPKSIYYIISHGLSESDLPMSVGCIAMVDAVASGVVYTRDPIDPDNDYMLINAVYGLGKYLVDGVMTPDVFRISRREGAVMESRPAQKSLRLALAAEGGIVEQEVSPDEQHLPSISEDHCRRLREFALKIEKHFDSPQDIEWALDREGRLFLLQARPLRLLRCPVSNNEADRSTLRILLSGGVTACPGAGSGAVHTVKSSDDLAGVPESSVLVAPSPFPGLITVMDKVRAVITEVGGVASHMATIAREYRTPTLVGLANASSLEEGRVVTVDATRGVVYDGLQADFLKTASRPQFELFDDTPVFSILDRVLSLVAPLNMINPKDPQFVPENCRTVHDITRFCHQMAMEEMFTSAEKVENKDKLGLQLESSIPLRVSIICIDEEGSRFKGKKNIHEKDLYSVPLRAFWNGVLREGWPASALPAGIKGLKSEVAGSDPGRSKSVFSEDSFAIISREYMIVGLHMGYHFMTIEALCTGEPGKNYIRMQYKEGKASLDRRIRRIKIILNILKRMGFENSSREDFLLSAIDYQDCASIMEKLELLGRITLMTKQLDMALSNDAIAEWYLNDFLKRLGLSGREKRGGENT
jgi:pyruvate,water dikinase